MKKIIFIIVSLLFLITGCTEKERESNSIKKSKGKSADFREFNK